jgi:Zn-dependent protease
VTQDPQPAPAASGLRVGRLGGVPIILRPSWFAVALVITVVFAPRARDVADGPVAHLVAFSFAVLLLLSVLVHELTHAVVARLAGTPATHVVLDVWGGHTGFAQEARTPLREIATAAGGPLSNLVLGLAALHLGGMDRPADVPTLLLQATAAANLYVAAFNALPGLPLDGGRVVAGLVWWVGGDRDRGTLVAGWTGRAVALAVAGVAVATFFAGYYGVAAAIWLIVVAVLLWQGAGQAVAVARWQQRSGRVRVLDVLRPAVQVPSTATVAGALTAASRAGAQDVVVLDVYGRPASVVDRAAAAAVPLARTREVRAAAVAVALPAGAVLPADLDGDGLIETMQATPAAQYAVVDAAEQVIGVLEWDEVARFVSGER